MSTIVLEASSAKSETSNNWLNATVWEFFTQVNWADQPPEVQAIQITALDGTAPEISLQLTVSQFFNAIPWDGKAVAAPLALDFVTNEASPPSGSSEFSVDDFADFF